MGKVNCFVGNNSRVESVEYVRNEISNQIQVPNLNFLIGSGCSSYLLDQKEMGIPVMRQMYLDFFSEYPDFRVGNKRINGLFNNNLEKMIEFLLSCVIVHDHIQVDEDIFGRIAEIKNFIRSKVIKGTECPEILSVYKKFLIKCIMKGRKNPVNLFTTNYDVYLESALDDLGYFYSNGFSGTYKRKYNPLVFQYSYVESMNLSKDVWNRVENYFNLFKVHGSITWVKENNEILERDYNYVNSEADIMIYPTPMKDRTTLMVPYSDLFRQMQGILLNPNSVLITLGYSFSDEHINRIILNNLAIPSFKLIIFGDSDNIKLLRSFDDPRIINIYSDEKIHYFNNFVDLILPEPQEEVEQYPKMVDIASAIAHNQKNTDGSGNE